MLLFTQEGRCIMEYQFGETAIINDMAWFQGHLIILHPVAGSVFITMLEVPCPTSSRLPVGQVNFLKYVAVIVLSKFGRD